MPKPNESWGSINQFLQEQMVALLGIPATQENDPVRAVQAGRDLQAMVRREGLFPTGAGKQRLELHGGIETGLVVSHLRDERAGRFVVTGRAAAAAMQLAGGAVPGQLVVGPQANRRVSEFFATEPLAGGTGHTDLGDPPGFRVLEPLRRPRRWAGLRAGLVGREVEMAMLERATEELLEKRGSVISICGAAGSGKSRLIEEYRNNLPEEIAWLEGRGYEHTLGFPFFPVLDLLRSAWEFEESDSPERMREKIESRVGVLLGANHAAIPFLGGLFSLDTPQLGAPKSPEFWRQRVQESLLAVFEATATARPTVFFLEDLHWADPSTLDLMREILPRFAVPAVILVAFRPPLALFPEKGRKKGPAHQQISLEDLSPSHSRELVGALLGGGEPPAALSEFIAQRSGGNPFFLEEMVTVLIEEGRLVREGGSWNLEGEPEHLELPATIQGVIAARVDRLGPENKRLLQEAAVIGQSFHLPVLKGITSLAQDPSKRLEALEDQELIYTLGEVPDTEYQFKHPITQEVVYNSLLRNDRREIHERVGRALETLFADRREQVLEQLAFHFHHGASREKAIDYLIQSAEKACARFSLEESHRNFQQAFDLLSDRPNLTEGEQNQLFDLLDKWGVVFYYDADFRTFESLLLSQLERAETLPDKVRKGNFYYWKGVVEFAASRLKESCESWRKSLALAEEVGDPSMISRACSGLCWVHTELGNLDEGAAWGERAKALSTPFPTDEHPFLSAFTGLMYNHFWKGNREGLAEVGAQFHKFGKEFSSKRSTSVVDFCDGFSNFIAGDFPQAIAASRKFIAITPDPSYAMAGTMLIGLCHASNYQPNEAQLAAEETFALAEKLGFDFVSSFSKTIRGLSLVMNGEMGRGMKLVEAGRAACLRNHRRGFLAMTELIKGKIYLEMIAGGQKLSLTLLIRNLPFLLKTLPFAAARAERHLTLAVDHFREMAAGGLLVQALLNLGLLHRARKRPERARECLREALELSTSIDADGFLAQARKALAELA